MLLRRDSQGPVQPVRHRQDQAQPLSSRPGAARLACATLPRLAVTALVTLAVCALAAAPALASVTMSTQAATHVAGTSAQLNGSAAGASSSDYCSFIYWTTSPSNYTLDYPATTCASSYDVNMAAVNTLTLSNWQQRPLGCDRQLLHTNPSSCPSFETGSGSGITGPAPQNLSLSTPAPAQVNAVSAVLQGESAGYLAGANGNGDYCSFLLWQQGSKPNATLATPAVPCTSSYSISVDGLTPDTTYAYAAAHCAAVSGQPLGPYYCDVTGAHSNPNEYDYADPCYFNANSDCTQFTTPAPSASAAPATSVLGTSAILNRQIFTEGEPTSKISWWFEYSTDASFATYAQTAVSPLDCPSPSGSSGACDVSAAVAGLGQGTTYYFRLVVSAADSPTGPQPSGAQSFITGGRALTDPATAVGASSATVNGELAPGDSPLSYNWVYSTTDTLDFSGQLQGKSVCSQSCGTVGAGADQLLSSRSAACRAPPPTTFSW
jgi:hypothetical protein